VKVFVVPRAGHAMFHHLNHRIIDPAVDHWLAKHNL
jgi:hypothetical protein